LLPGPYARPEREQKEVRTVEKGDGLSFYESLSTEGEMLNEIRRYASDEQGAEMVEWVVVVVVLAVVASIVFGPNGVLQNAIKDGVNKIATIISALPTT
jgi:Flp pilus assembly pilin Flp